MQLGGKNPGIVFSDTDLDKCLPAMIKSSFANQGEICLTTSRIYVQEPIYDKFVERFVHLTKLVKCTVVCVRACVKRCAWIYVWRKSIHVTAVIFLLVTLQADQGG